MEEKRSYYAVIPANVRYDKSLKPNAKLLYGEITALCNEKGYCWATNDYFSSLYEVSKETVSRWISQLKDKNYISVKLVYKEGTSQIINRYLQISQYPIDEKINTPIDKKIKENNTSFNNTVNNTYNKDRVADEKKGFIPPTIQEVTEYVEKNSINVDPEYFITYYGKLKWHDAYGNPIKNWKNKLRNCEEWPKFQKKEVKADETVEWYLKQKQQSGKKNNTEPVHA